MRSVKTHNRSEQGFTIIELMIALSIMAIILVMCSVMLIGLGRAFTKGTNQANTQNAARNIMNDLAYAIEFSASNPQFKSGSPAHNSESWCFGTTRYTFIRQKQLGSQAQHVMWRDTLLSSSTCPVYNLEAPPPANIATDPAAEPGSGSEMVSENMGIADLKFATNPNGVYTLNLIVSYGKFGAGGDFDTSQKQCSNGQDSSFCATAVLERSVFRRL